MSALARLLHREKFDRAIVALNESKAPADPQIDAKIDAVFAAAGELSHREQKLMRESFVSLQADGSMSPKSYAIACQRLAEGVKSRRQSTGSSALCTVGGVGAFVFAAICVAIGHPEAIPASVGATLAMTAVAVLPKELSYGRAS